MTAMTEIIEALKPKPIQIFTKETDEMKRFHEVSEALKNVGIYGEENTIAACEAIGLKSYCDEVKK